MEYYDKNLVGDNKKTHMYQLSYILGGERGACGTFNYRNPIRKFAIFPFTESIK